MEETKKICRATAGRTTLNTLTDTQIIRRGDAVVRSRHELAIELVDCLAEIERRALHLKKGYSSLFDYCTRRWNFSPSKTGRFIAAMRSAKKFPEVRTLLIDRKLTVCGAARVARLLTEENREELLRQVSGQRYIDIERIVASRRIAPKSREIVRPIGKRAVRRKKSGGRDDLFERREEKKSGEASDSRAPRDEAERPAEGGGAAPDYTQNGCEFRRDWNPGSGPPAGTMPGGRDCRDFENETEERFEIRFSASAAFLAKMERAKAILSRRWSIEALLEKTLDEFLERHDPERKVARREKRNARKGRPGRERHVTPEELFPATAGAPKSVAGPGLSSENCDSRKDPPGAERSIEKRDADRKRASGKRRSRHIPAALRDAVFLRDDGRCTWIGDDGVRCSASAHLQVDHIVPFCRGGKHELGNLRLLCGKHNRLAALELLGAR